jgi:hypothetical protein
MNPELNSQLARVRTREMLAQAARPRTPLFGALKALRARQPR